MAYETIYNIIDDVWYSQEWLDSYLEVADNRIYIIDNIVSIIRHCLKRKNTEFIDLLVRNDKFNKLYRSKYYSNFKKYIYILLMYCSLLNRDAENFTKYLFMPIEGDNVFAVFRRLYFENLDYVFYSNKDGFREKVLKSLYLYLSTHNFDFADNPSLDIFLERTKKVGNGTEKFLVEMIYGKHRH